MLSVGMHRFKTQIGVGIGADQHLERKMRRHGNLAENSAIFLVLLALAELAGAPQQVMIGFAGAFAVARLSHVIGFSTLGGSHDPNAGGPWVMFRALGAFGTIGSGVGLAGYLVYFLYLT